MNENYSLALFYKHYLQMVKYVETSGLIWHIDMNNVTTIFYGITINLDAVVDPLVSLEILLVFLISCFEATFSKGLLVKQVYFSFNLSLIWSLSIPQPTKKMNLICLPWTSYIFLQLDTVCSKSSGFFNETALFSKVFTDNELWNWKARFGGRHYIHQ